MLTAIIFIVILGVLVFVHELGHFLVAKLSGIRVDEFALGFPPRIVSKKMGETVYALNVVPFGGYVKIHGEDPSKPGSHRGADDPRSFASKNRFIQALVLVGGVAMNFVFAWLLFSGIFMTGALVSQQDYPGKTLEDSRLMITDIFPDSPAAASGFKPGDVIVGLKSDTGTQKSPTLEETQEFISANEGKNIAIEIKRGSEELSLETHPIRGVVEGRVSIGIGLDIIGKLKLLLPGALVEGAKKTYELTTLIAWGLGHFIFDALHLSADLSSVSGPVGIANFVGEARSLGFLYLISFTALISINLGVINLVPFPALDGGRLLFVLIEAIIRRPLHATFVRTANGVGFALLMLLLIVVTYRDVVKIFWHV